MQTLHTDVSGFIWKIYHESETALNRQDPALYSDLKNDLNRRKVKNRFNQHPKRFK